MRPWFVYILRCDQKTFYVGRTTKLKGRITEHQRGYSPFTKKFSDIQLVYQEQYQGYRKAEQRENQLKKWSVTKKKALIAGNKTLLRRLSRGHGLVDEVERRTF